MGIVDDVREAADRVVAALRGSGCRADFSPGSRWEIERFFETEAPDGQVRPNGLLARQLGAAGQTPAALRTSQVACLRWNGCG